MHLDCRGGSMHFRADWKKRFYWREFKPLYRPIFSKEAYTFLIILEVDYRNFNALIDAFEKKMSFFSGFIDIHIIFIRIQDSQDGRVV